MSQNIDFAFCSFTFLFLPLSTSSKSGLAFNFNFSRPWEKDKFRYSGYGDSVSLHVVKVRFAKKFFLFQIFFFLMKCYTYNWDPLVLISEVAIIFKLVCNLPLKVLMHSYIHLFTYTMNKWSLVLKFYINGIVGYITLCNLLMHQLFKEIFPYWYM